MNYQIKLFRWPDKGDHIIMITRGPIDLEGFRQILKEVAQVVQPLLDCKVLIDLQDATCELTPADIDALVKGIGPDLWPHDNKVALVSPAEVEEHEKLALLVAALCHRAFRTAVFYDPKSAISWLAEIP
jgi:hypothetical protein